MAATLLAILLATSHATAQGVDARPNERSDPRDTLQRLSYSDGTDVLSIGMEAVAPIASGSFFEGYSRLGGRQGDMGFYPALRLTGRRAMNDRTRAVIDIGLHRASFGELYEVRTGTPPTTQYVASVQEDVAVTAVPLLAGIEYTPIRAQFTSYAGVAAGPAVTYASWITGVVHGTGYSRPRANVQSYGISPALRAYVGVDLRFDRLLRVPSAFRGLYLEATYLWLPVTRDYFQALRANGNVGPNEDSGTLFLGGLSFTFGLNLQVLRR